MPRIPAGRRREEAERKHEERRQERQFCPPPINEPIEEPIEEPSVAVAMIEPEPIPAPPPKKPLPPASDLVAEEIERERRLAVAREELVFRRHELLAEGQDLSAAEYRLLQTGCPRVPGQNDYEYRQTFGEYLNREANRVQTILSLQGRAGSPADREAADALAEKTQRKLDVESPELEQRIRELQEQLSALHLAANVAKTAASDRHAAVSELKGEHLLPSFVRDEIAAARRVDEGDFGAELRKLESRIRSLRGLLDIDPENPVDLEVIKHHVSGNRHFGNDELECLKSVFEFSTEQRPGGVAHRFGAIRPEVWGKYLDEIRVELEAAESRIAAIAGGEQAASDQKIEAMRSHYVPN